MTTLWDSPDREFFYPTRAIELHESDLSGAGYWTFVQLKHDETVRDFDADDLRAALDLWDRQVDMNTDLADIYLSPIQTTLAMRTRGDNTGRRETPALCYHLRVSESDAVTVAKLVSHVLEQE